MIMFLLVALSGQMYESSQWVKLGESNVTWGYKTPYRINLMVPRGMYDIDDIKNGMQVMQFEIEWLAPETPQEQVVAHFEELVKTQLGNDESIKFNQVIIKRFTDKLPAAKRFDRWHFIFSPDAGTEIRIAGQNNHTIIGAEVNRALHQAWLFRDPVTTSKLLTRLLKLGK